MASLLNPPSTPTTSYPKNNKFNPHSFITSTNLQNISSSFQSETNSKTSNNVDDLSWLPNYDDNSSASASDSIYETGQNDFDYSWLPNYNDFNPSSISNNSNRVQKTQNDSWLPSTPTVKNGNKNKEQHHVHDDSWLPNYRSKTTSKCNNLNLSQKTGHIVNNGNKNNENSNDKKLLNKKPESLISSQGQDSPCKSECSVETDSLGGVSTLLRRWKDLVETTNSNDKTISSKSGSRLAESKNNNPSGSRSWKDLDASKRGASPTTTNDSFVDSKPLSCLTSRVINDSKAENDKIRVINIINKLSKEEFPSRNTNESFTQICNPRWIHGCQAFKEFLSLKEQDKRYELESLAQSKPVSKFSYRSRIKALLHLRFTWLESDSETEDGKQDANSEFLVHNRADELYDDEKSTSNWQEALENSCHHWVINEWDYEEEEDDDEAYDMHDWISEIARPRSEWELMRQARYREMLYLLAYNRDIQELLKRKCVSSFLSSDHLRGKIDKLMVSRAEGLLHQEVGGTEWKKEEEDGESRLQNREKI